MNTKHNQSQKTFRIIEDCERTVQTIKRKIFTA